MHDTLLSDLPSWWGRSGGVGGFGTTSLSAGQPWTLAGLSVGARAVGENDGVPLALPPPGLLGAHSPLAWHDSLAVVLAGDAAWEGFDAALAGARGFIPRSGSGRGRTVVDLKGGDFGLDENGLTIARGDSARWLATEVMEGRSGTAAGFEKFGRHLWGVSTGTRRKRHALVAGFRQRGTAAILLGEEEQSFGGESGYVEHRYEVGNLHTRLSLRRGLTRGQSIASSLEGSRRDAQATDLGVEAGRTGSRDVMAVRASWRRERVDRSGEGEFSGRATSGWVAGRYQRRLGDGWVHLGLGAGGHGAFDGVQIAPEISYSTLGGPVTARIGIERLVHPVWTDLAVGEDAFMQRTWAGVIEVSGRWPRARGRVSALGGSTQDRALVHHLPLEELWLREGYTRALATYRFGLIQAEGTLWWRGFEVGGEGFALARDQDEDVALVEPAHGLRSRAGWGFAAFEGDFSIRIGGHLDRVGPRESELFGAPERRLPGYWTLGATGVVTLADALLTIGVRNLEDRPREEVWFDTSTGSEALGPGRAWRFALTLRLDN